MSRANSLKGRSATTLREETQADEPPALTRAQIRELGRRIRDLDDRTRYFLASVLTAKHALYYNVSEDTFGMGDPSFATLFKRRSAAQAIQRLLSKGVQLAACRVNRRGRLVLRSVPQLRPVWGRKDDGNLRPHRRRN